MSEESSAHPGLQNRTAWGVLAVLVLSSLALGALVLLGRAAEPSEQAVSTARAVGVLALESSPEPLLPGPSGLPIESAARETPGVTVSAVDAGSAHAVLRVLTDDGPELVMLMFSDDGVTAGPVGSHPHS